jgi:hypothetical protein
MTWRIRCSGFLLLLTAVSALAADGSSAANRTNLVPAWLVQMPETVNDVLVADTAGSRLVRLERRDDRFVETESRYMSIGTRGVGKERAWDRRTPLGIFFVTHELDTGKLPAKYGIAAYPLDYPNAWDRYQQRTGDGIWIHGVNPATPIRPALDTDGCLALPNDELASLGKLLRPLITPVIVTRNMRWVDPGRVRERSAGLRDAVESWRQSNAKADLFSHLALYSDEFRYETMRKPDWAAYKQGVFSARGPISLDLEDVMLLEDPEEEGLFVSRFRQVATTASGGRVEIIKRLYWRRNDGQRWQVVTEDAG